EANNEPSNQTSNEEQPTAQPPRPVEQQGNAASTATAPATTNPVAAQTVAEDDEETRPPGDVDFGQLLDQFEQEQASTLQEGEVVRGTVVGVTERGVVIDFGYKSEGIVPQGEFMEGGQLTVKPGDEVDVLVKNMETSEGFPVLSRADAVRMKAWDD